MDYHRPVDYSLPCGLLYSPAHSLHAVRCRQRSSRRPPPLPCRLLTLPGIKVALKADASTDVNRLFPSASRPLSPWQQLHGTPGEDVRLDPHHLHLPLSSLNGDLAPDLVGFLPPSAGYRYILSASAATGLPATTRSRTVITSLMASVQRKNWSQATTGCSRSSLPRH